MPSFIRPRLVVLSIYLICGSTIFAQKSIDLNMGLSASKSVLGLSYTDGTNQANVGLRGLAYSSRDGLYVEPGIAYNKYFTENGFYATAVYTIRYYSGGSDVSAPSTIEIDAKKGWESGVILGGLGKSFQFTHWGLHVDGGIGTQANPDFADAWGLWLGGAASYRFHLD